MSRLWRERGLVLAEWLLASLLGVLILAAALAWLQASLQLALRQRVPTQMTDDAIWLFGRLEQAAMQAGAGGVHPLAWQDDSLRSWRSLDAIGPGHPASDQLLLQRRLASATVDCEGTMVPAGWRLVERYFLRTDNAAPGWVLACDGGACLDAVCQRLGDAGAALQSEIDSFQVLYGVRDATSQSPHYVDASRLPSPGEPAPRVASLRIGLLLRGRERFSMAQTWRQPADWLGWRLALPADALPRSAWQMTLEVPHG